MPKPRKMLSDIDAPYIRSLMRLIQTQSNATISEWCVDYAEKSLLPLWESAFPEDNRPKDALGAARDCLTGNIKPAEVKKLIILCRNAARESAGSPIAQGAARAIDASASSIHNPAGSLGLALYGGLAIAYSKAGLEASWENLEQIAAAECGKMEAALREIAIEDEPNPAKINWNC